jgi:hypothetical protein
MTDGRVPAAPGVWTPPGIKIFRDVVLCAGLAAMSWEMLSALGFPFSRPPPALGLGLLGLAALASERLRLPFQNGVALALLSGGTGCFAMAWTRGHPSENRPWLVAFTLGLLAGPAARNAARELLRAVFRRPPVGWALPGLTLTLGIVIWTLGQPTWLRPTGSGTLPSAAGLSSTLLPVVCLLVLQFALTPWWIDKRRIAVPADPRSALPWLGAVLTSGVLAWSGTR